MHEREADIQQACHTIEAQEQVRILYACESGSRAWGFASHDSDYDVRFLYVRPQRAYLRLDLPRDVIERPIVDDLDINGWDIFKALRLLRKSNPPLLEWQAKCLEDIPAVDIQVIHDRSLNHITRQVQAEVSPLRTHIKKAHIVIAIMACKAPGPTS